MNNLCQRIRRATLRTLASLCLCCFITQALAQQADSSDASKLDPQDLAASANERVWLNTDSGKRLAFYLSEKSGTAHGGVLIIPDRGIHPAVTGTINSLRHTLAKHHWHTLALDISSLDAEAVPGTIAAGVAQLNAEGVFNIAILGNGQGAVYALQYVAKLPPPEKGKFQQIRALVMLNADNFSGTSDHNPMAALADIKLPVLDAWYANDYNEQQKARQRREQAAGANNLYQQARIPYVAVQNPGYENRITKRIRGWLDKNIAGFMVDKGGSAKNNP